MLVIVSLVLCLSHRREPGFIVIWAVMQSFFPALHKNSNYNGCSAERLLASTVHLGCNSVRNVTTLRKRGLAKLM